MKSDGPGRSPSSGRKAASRPEPARPFGHTEGPAQPAARRGSGAWLVEGPTWHSGCRTEAGGKEKVLPSAQLWARYCSGQWPGRLVGAWPERTGDGGQGGVGRGVQMDTQRKREREDLAPRANAC